MKTAVYCMGVGMHLQISSNVFSSFLIEFSIFGGAMENIDSAKQHELNSLGQASIWQIHLQIIV